MRIRQFRVVSLVLTALSIGGAAATVAMTSPAQAAVRVNAAETCLIGVDFQSINYNQLYAALASYVKESGNSASFADMVSQVGGYIARSSAQCSPQELAALIKNVAVILEDLGVDANGHNIEYLVAVIEPIRQIDVAVLDETPVGTSIY